MSGIDWEGAVTASRSQAHEYRLFVREIGPKNAAPLLFLHGFPTSSLDWSKIAPAFGHRRSFFPDLLGFGRSDKPAIRYSYPLQADLITDLLAKRGVNQVDIVAHDYSVTLVQELLRREQEVHPSAPRIRRIVFLNGGVFGRLHRKQRAHRLLMLPLLGPVFARRITPATLTRGLNAISGCSEAWDAIDGERHWREMACNDGLSRLPRLLHYIADRRRNGAGWEAAMTAAAARCAFVWGQEDPVSGAHVLAEVSIQCPDAQTVRLNGVGHYPHWEAPDQTAKAILNALEPAW